MDIKTALLKNVKTATLIDIVHFSQELILNAAASVLNSGIKIIQFCAVTATDKQNIETAQKLRQLCSIFNALLIINSRPDIAQIVDADGICLFENDMSIENAKKILHDDKIIAIHAKTLENAIEAVNNNVDYVCIDSLIKPSLKDNLNTLNKIKIINLDRQYL